MNKVLIALFLVALVALTMAETPKKADKAPKDGEKTPKVEERTVKDGDKTIKSEDKTVKDGEKTPRKENAAKGQARSKRFACNGFGAAESCSTYCAITGAKNGGYCNGEKQCVCKQ